MYLETEAPAHRNHGPLLAGTRSSSCPKAPYDACSRNDFAAHVAELALPIDEAEPFTLLSRTGGRRTTTSLKSLRPRV